MWLMSHSLRMPLTDGCERVEINIVYHCLLFCFQSAVAWKTQIRLGKMEN